MKKKVSLFGGGLFLFLFLAFVSSVSAQLVSSLNQYCVDGSGNALGYYLADGGKSCGRAPYCAGKSYDEVANGIDWESVSACWVDRPNQCTNGANVGEVPLCCYEIERTGNPMFCTWPERGYCHQTNCANIPDGGSWECGTKSECNCGDSLVTHARDDCGITNISYIPLAQRLGTAATPTTTKTPTPTLTPTPTSALHPCLASAKAGDYNCSGSVTSADFDAWKADFLQNKSTLSFFEYWRRAAY